MSIGVYVAGPLYSSGDLLENVRVAIRAGEMLENIGRGCGIEVRAFVPHVTLVAQQLVAPKDHVDAQAWDDFWLRRCDALWRLPGVSKGTDHEVALAQELGLPIFSDAVESEFITWLRSLHA